MINEDPYAADEIELNLLHRIACALEEIRDEIRKTKKEVD